jgi:hypothetical protein
LAPKGQPYNRQQRSRKRAPNPMNRESTAEMTNSFIISLVNLVEVTFKKEKSTQ